MRFRQLALLPPTSKSVGTQYDIAFGGTPLDLRGRTSIDMVKASAKSFHHASYDANGFLVTIEGCGDIRADSLGQISKKLPAKKVLLDATTLDFPELLLLIKAYFGSGQMSCSDLALLYLEPGEYTRKKDEADAGASKTHSFALSDGYGAFLPIPGFMPELRPSRQGRMLAFAGFESARLTRALGEENGEYIEESSIVFGVPPFKVTWEIHAMMEHAELLREKQVTQVLFAAANNPRSAYQLIEKQRSGLPSNRVLMLAPLGTKPASIAVALYAATHDDVRVVFDFPKRKIDRTDGVGRIHHYVVSN